MRFVATMLPSTNPPGQPRCQISKRAASMRSISAMEVMREAAHLEAMARESQTPDLPKVLHLQIGQPSTAPPKPVLNTIASVPTPFGYTTSLGLPSLRTAISRHYDEWYDVHVPSSCIAVTTGGSGAILAAFTTCFDEKDRVAVAFPGYPCYPNVLNALSVEVVPIHVDADTNYQPSIEQLRHALPLAGVIVASPTNPTGSVIKEADLAELVAFCRQNSMRLIVDEIYHGIGPLPPTAMEYEDVVVINSFSKYWCMTGLRIGWLATRDAAVIDAVDRCIQNYTLCAPTLSQHAAETALKVDCRTELDAHVARYQRNQKVLVKHLTACGFQTTAVPDGAFYVWSRCDNVCRKIGVKDSTELCSILLRETRVVVNPGIDFDPDRGQHFLRFSCAGSEQDVAEAAKRIYDFCS